MSRPRIALLDSGLGLTTFADALHTAAPGIDLILATDPIAMPYGALTPDQIIERIHMQGEVLRPLRPDAIIIACNTASVHALAALRSQFEPQVPVIGTVPAIKSAAATGAPFAVWATTATTGSAYQRELLSRFAPGLQVAEIACRGLAQAIDQADAPAIEQAVARGAAATPPWAQSVVLGCTHYGLVAQQIRDVLPHVTQLFDSPQAVAAQALHRLEATSTTIPDDDGGRVIAVFASGEPADLPQAMQVFPAGQRLLSIVDYPRETVGHATDPQRSTPTVLSPSHFHQQ